MNVGDYVRTNEGTIAKIESKRDYTHGDYEGGESDLYLNVNHSYQDYELIIKSSPKPIDLIQLGDYVNGGCVYDIVEENKEKGQPRILFVETDGVIGNEDIKSIVTKEVFESMEYRIGE